MKYKRIIFVDQGQKQTCPVCGLPKFGPCELYEYEDVEGLCMSVCFDCRMYCGGGKRVRDFVRRRTVELK